jgi:hypothetical protein
MENQHGLKRTIPAEIAREIRRRSKFGCVICREAICDYEHIDPVFADAHEHNPNHMCLLCSSCHDKVSRGIWSKTKVQENYLNILSSAEIRPPFSEFDIRAGSWFVQLGPCRFTLPSVIFAIDGTELLGFYPPEESGAPPRLNGRFQDDAGQTILEIADNIWHGNLSNTWDIQTKGKEITIRRDKNQIALRIVVDPPLGIHVTHLNMRYGSTRFWQHDKLLHIERAVAGGLIDFGIDGDCFGARACLDVDTGIQQPSIESIAVIGGEGVALRGSGIVWGRGAGGALIRRITLQGYTVFDVENLT